MQVVSAPKQDALREVPLRVRMRGDAGALRGRTRRRHLPRWRAAASRSPAWSAAARSSSGLFFIRRAARRSRRRRPRPLPHRRLALLQQSGSQDIIRLQPGDALDDWVLMNVAADRVTLRRGAERRELRLHR